jgi:hypothetical protein
MTFVPQNDLERSLVQAAKDPSHVPQFYRVLAKSEVLVLSADPPSVRPAGWVNTEADTTIRLRHMEFDGKPCLPLFSSLERLREVASDVGYYALNSIDLLRMTAGTPLLLNPGSEYGKEIAVDEAARIVDGTIEGPLQSRTVEKATKILIGEPARYPKELVEILKQFLRKRRSVRRAWVALFHDASQGEPPHTLIAIEADGDYREAIAGIGFAIERAPIPDPPVDVVSAEFLNDHFRTKEPFYERRLLDWRPGVG